MRSPTPASSILSQCTFLWWWWGWPSGWMDRSYIDTLTHKTRIPTGSTLQLWRMRKNREDKKKRRSMLTRLSRLKIIKVWAKNRDEVHTRGFNGKEDGGCRANIWERKTTRSAWIRILKIFNWKKIFFFFILQPGLSEIPSGSSRVEQNSEGSWKKWLIKNSEML